MSGASNYTEQNIINALLRGQAFDQASAVYVSLHVSDPGETGANEVTTAQWPDYLRLDAAKGGTIDSGWTAPVDGQVKNAKQLIYAVYNGTGSITVSHFGLFDAANGGNYLVGAQLDTVRTLQPGDVFVVNVEKLTVRVL